MLVWLNIATIAGWAISSLLVVGVARAGSPSLTTPLKSLLDAMEEGDLLPLTGYESVVAARKTPPRRFENWSSMTSEVEARSA
jgi:hypothetical protein